MIFEDNDGFFARFAEEKIDQLEYLDIKLSGWMHCRYMYFSCNSEAGLKWHNVRQNWTIELQIQLIKWLSHSFCQAHFSQKAWDYSKLW